MKTTNLPIFRPSQTREWKIYANIQNGASAAAPSQPGKAASREGKQAGLADERGEGMGWDLVRVLLLFNGFKWSCGRRAARLSGGPFCAPAASVVLPAPRFRFAFGSSESQWRPQIEFEFEFESRLQLQLQFQSKSRRQPGWRRPLGRQKELICHRRAASARTSGAAGRG